ncbi:hypothetical protein DY052_08455 [Apilactobacillus timberlakei]|uniref:hypothetical protein n=1 Tax=Apilactobacillus timberlakei TaxID=2008380 RepID=UPI0011262C4C|nr:hypothetical protein [Apilactobacillus timberlakei]TPR13021.1 hypothetical protein DY052_08455 [Apilactobacillus timberlakei]
MEKLNHDLFIETIKILYEEGANDDARLYNLVHMYMDLTDNKLNKELATQQIHDYLVNELFLVVFEDLFEEHKRSIKEFIDLISLDSSSDLLCDGIMYNCNDLKKLINENIFKDQIMTLDEKPMSVGDLLKAATDPYSI